MPHFLFKMQMFSQADNIGWQKPINMMHRQN
jgi:hypothetical protein